MGEVSRECWRCGKPLVFGQTECVCGVRDADAGERVGEVPIKMVGDPPMWLHFVVLGYVVANLVLGFTLLLNFSLVITAVVFVVFGLRIWAARATLAGRKLGWWTWLGIACLDLAMVWLPIAVFGFVVLLYPSVFQYCIVEPPEDEPVPGRLAALFQGALALVVAIVGAAGGGFSPPALLILAWALAMLIALILFWHGARAGWVLALVLTAVSVPAHLKMGVPAGAALAVVCAGLLLSAPVRSWVAASAPRSAPG
jgi:hypothetical protein